MKKSVLALMLVLAVLLSACGQSGGQSPAASGDASTPGAGSSAAPSGSAPAPEASAPDKAVVGIVQDFDSLDPNISVATGTQEVMFNIFHGLINTTPGGEIVPELCESYTVSDDAKVYTFNLRKDVKFHNGQPLTSADVAYTYLRYMGKTEDTPAALNAEFEKWIESIETPDDHTVVFNLFESNAAFISRGIASIVPENSASYLAENPIGTGPYKFVSYTPGIGISMERNEDYYAEKPALKYVDFKIFDDVNAGQLALQNGEIHILMNVVGANITFDESKIKMSSLPRNTIQLMGLNNTFEPFKDVRVRQALNYATNKQELIAAVAPGSPQIDTSFCPVMEYYYNFDLVDYYPHDPEKAKALLAEAGYSDLTFDVKVPAEYKQHVDTSLLMKQQFEQVGVTMNIVTIEWNTWLSEVYSEFNHEATIVGLTGKIDPGQIMDRFLSDYYRNFCQYNNPEYDRIVKEADSSTDQVKRAELYKQAQAMLAEEAAAIFIMDPCNNVLMDKRIEGFLAYPIGYIDMRSVYFA